MFDDHDREELLELVESVYKEMRECIEKKRVLPQSISHGGGRVRVSIEILKIPDTEQTQTILCLCDNEYEDDPAGMTIEPRCPQCALEFTEQYPDMFMMPPKAREIAEQYVIAPTR